MSLAALHAINAGLYVIGAGFLVGGLHGEFWRWYVLRRQRKLCNRPRGAGGKFM